RRRSGSATCTAPITGPAVPSASTRRNPQFRDRPQASSHAHWSRLLDATDTGIVDVNGRLSRPCISSRCKCCRVLGARCADGAPAFSTRHRTWRQDFLLSHELASYLPVYLTWARCKCQANLQISVIRALTRSSIRGQLLSKSGKSLQNYSDES